MSEAIGKSNTAEPASKSPAGKSLFDIVPLQKLPLSAADFRELTIGLKAHERDALWMAIEYSWRHGASLPSDDRGKAAVVGTTVGRWIEMAPRLAPFFAFDDEGCWSMPELIEQRRKHLDADAKAREDGRRGGLKRAENARRRQDELRETERREKAERSSANAGSSPFEDAGSFDPAKGSPSVAQGYPSQTLAFSDTNPSSLPQGSAVASYGLTDCSASPLDVENPVSPSVYTISQEGHDTHDPGTLEHARDPCEPREATPLADGSRPGSRVESTNPCPTLEPAAPSGDGDRSTERVESTRSAVDGTGPSEDEIAATVEQAGGARVDVAWRSLDCMKKLRAELRDRRFELPDLATAIAAVTTERHKDLRNPAAQHVIEAARRAFSLRTLRSPNSSSSATARLYLEDPDFDAIVRALEKPPAKIDPLRESSPPYREYRALPAADLEQARRFVSKGSSSHVGGTDQARGGAGREAPA